MNLTDEALLLVIWEDEIQCAWSMHDDKKNLRKIAVFVVLPLKKSIITDEDL